jgi:DNA-binding CsgD family transcriptional regulator/tetratricopeptide (TPR) repeat protein
VALALWWHLRGRWIQGADLLRRAVEQTGPDVGPWYTAHWWLGYLARMTFDNDIALRHYGTVVQALQDRPPSPDLVDGLVGRSGVLRNTSDLEHAKAAARTALEFARQIGYATGEATALRELSLISWYADDGDHAVECARQALRIDRDRMPGWCAREVEGVLPFVLADKHPDGALEPCVQALTQARAAGDLGNQADMLFLMAVLARKTRRLADARAHLREATELAAHAGYRLRLIDILDEGGYWCAASRQYAAAVTLWAARDTQCQAFGLIDTPSEKREREQPLQEAAQALGAQQVRAAQDRGAGMTLAAAVEFAVMMTAEHAPPPALPQPGKLSTRERELVALVARGQTDAQIAEQLFISVSTVRTHLDRIRDKSGFRRRADLTRLALNEGII